MINRQKKIYFYSTQAHYEDQIQLGRIPMLKIGDTQQEEAEDRINQQDTTSNPQQLLPKGVFETTFGDKEFHKYLLQRGYKKTRDDKDREWFFITVEDATYELEQYQGAQSVSKVAETRQLYKHQQEFVNKVLSNWEQWKEFLLFAKCRAGKSMMVLSAIVESGVKVTLVVSRYKSPEQSWREDSNLKNFENLVYIDLNKKGYEQEIEKYLKTDKQLILWGCIQSRKLTSLPCNIDLIVYDEAHVGYGSKQWTELQESHNCKVLYVTGTAYKLQFDFDKKNSYVYSYFEEQLDAKLGLNQGRTIPKLKLFVAQYQSQEYQKLFGNDPAAMKNIFNTLPNGDFIHPFLVQEFVDMYFSSQRTLRPQDRIFKDSTHIYATLPSVAACHAFSKFVTGTRFAPLVVTGETDEDAQTINAHIELNPCGTIILTRSANVLGVTAPKIDTVVNMTEGKSLEFYIQFAFRGGSGDKDWNLFDFCPERAVRAFSNIFTEACDANQNLSEYVFGDFIDVFSWSNGFKQLSSEEINDILAINIEETISLSSNFVDRMNADILSGIDCSTVLKSASHPHLPLQDDIQINSNDTNSKGNKQRVGEQTEREVTINETKEQVREYLKRVPLAVFHCVRKGIPTTNIDSFLNSEHYVYNTYDVDGVLKQYFDLTSGEETRRFAYRLNQITTNIKSSIHQDELRTLEKLSHSGQQHQVLDVEFVENLLSNIS